MNEENKIVSQDILNIIWNHYNLIPLNEIFELLKSKYLKEVDIVILNKIISVLSAICWAPRYKSTDSLKLIYSSEFIGCDQSIIQFMYGRFLNNTIHNYFYLNNKDCISDKEQFFNVDSLNTNFNDLFCYFLKNRNVWQQLISSNLDFNTFHLRLKNTFSITTLVGHKNMYAFFIPFIEKLYDRLSSGEIIPYVSLEINDRNTSESLIKHDKVKIKFSITENIHHYCCLCNYGIDESRDVYNWNWICDSNIQDDTIWIALNELHQRILYDIIKQQNLNKELIAMIYYAIVSLSPLNRGSASIAEMFRKFYSNLFFKVNPFNDNNFISCIKLEFAQLDGIALCTPPLEFIENMDNDLYFDIFDYSKEYPY